MKHSVIRVAVISALGVLLCVGIGPAISSQTSDVSNQVFKTEHMWDARVTIGDRISVGASKNGERHIIPILGGTFKGPKIQGEVMPMGEDWQLVRPDGDIELYARYLLKTNDGFYIQVINRALIHAPAGGKVPPYIRSVLDLEAPIKSPYDYLNHAVFLGTLAMPQLKPDEKSAVIIGVHRVL